MHAFDYFVNMVFLRKVSVGNLIFLHKLNSERRPFKVDEDGNPVTFDVKYLERLCLENPLNDAVNDISMNSPNLSKRTRTTSIEDRELRFSLAKPKFGATVEEVADKYNDPDVSKYSSLSRKTKLRNFSDAQKKANKSKCC